MECERRMRIGRVPQSGRPDSNRRRPAWEAGILPLNYARDPEEGKAEKAEVKEAKRPLFPRGSLQKAPQIRLADGRLPRCYVVQPPFSHPLLQLAHQFEQVIERVDDEQQRLIAIDLEVLVDHPFELHGVALHLGGVDVVCYLSERAEQTAAIHAELFPLTHQAELDSEPKESSHGLEDAGHPPDFFLLILDSRHDLGCGVRAIAEPNQGVGKCTVGVHGNVTGYIVKNVWFREVVECCAVPNGDGGRKLPISKTIEEQERGNVSTHRLCLEAGEWTEKSIHVLQPRHARRIEAEAVDTLDETRVCILTPALLHAREQPAPGVVVGFGVELVGLVNVQPALFLGLLDERRFRCRQAAAGSLLYPYSCHENPLLLLLISPGSYSLRLCLDLDWVSLSGLEPWNLDLLVRDNRTLSVQELENEDERLGYQRFPLGGLAFASSGRRGDARSISGRCELTDLYAGGHCEQADSGLIRQRLFLGHALAVR